MRPEAEKILAVFKARSLRSGAQIHPSDFGDAIVWENGGVRDEGVRLALEQLFENGYLSELLAGFELTEKGDLFINGGGEDGLTLSAPTEGTLGVVRLRFGPTKSGSDQLKGKRASSPYGRGLHQSGGCGPEPAMSPEALVESCADRSVADLESAQRPPQPGPRVWLSSHSGSRA